MHRDPQPYRFYLKLSLVIVAAIICAAFIIFLARGILAHQAFEIDRSNRAQLSAIRLVNLYRASWAEFPGDENAARVRNALAELKELAAKSKPEDRTRLLDFAKEVEDELKNPPH